MVLLILCIQRAATIRHPNIALGTFGQHNMLFIFILFGCMTLMSATATSTEKYMLYLPLVFKGAGVSLVYTSLTYALAGCVTFVHYFEAMCVIGFIRTSFGDPLNSAILARLFKYVSLENTATLGGEIDAMHPMAHSFMALYGEFQRQILLVSLKEVYGYAVIVAIVILLAILASDYRWLIRPNRMWRLAQIWRVVRRQSKQIEATSE